ncbi:MAG: hypothetical protein GF346_00635 [Candidatus Eisenbacteria bacterium]|nr:hypothetical protein [Candidatus Latescibacterota bacterium]MBD3300937.1 hypothetical protein [Candidatus Eisenbacteria bacterium]
MRRSGFAALVIGFLALCAGPGAAETWNVEQDGSGDFLTIQAAIDAASSGDLVLVGPGRYTDLHEDEEGAPTIVALKSGVEIRSTDGPDATILDAEAEGERRAVSAYGVDNGSRLAGFTIRGGDAPTGGGVYLYASEAHITGNRVVDNLAGEGAGIACDGPGTPRIEGNEVRDNVACCGPGGGILCTGGSSAEIIANVVERNEGFGGGGIGLSQAGAPLVAENEVGRNVGLSGGGLAVIATAARVERNRIVENEAQSGGGIISWSGGGATFSHNVVARNRSIGDGGGYHISADAPLLENETVVANSSFLGSGIFVWNNAAARIEKCIVAFNLDGEGIYADDPGSVPSVQCCDVFGHDLGDYGGFLDDQTGVASNLSVDPRFCDRENDDYRLQDRSPLRLLVDAAGSGCGLRGALEDRCDRLETRAAAGEDAGTGAWIAVPNPAGEAVRLLAAEGSAEELPPRLVVVDVRGRRVRTLLVGAEGTPVWDGRDARGRPVANGLYLLTGTDGRVLSRVLLRR